MRNQQTICLVCAVLLGIMAGCADIRYAQMNADSKAISKGRGAERDLSGKDRFTRFLDFLNDQDKDVRSGTSFVLSPCAAMGSGYYLFIVDAYIDAGRGTEAVNALEEAFKRAEKGSSERFGHLSTFIEVKVRLFIWDKPALRKLMRLENPVFGGRGLGFGSLGGGGFYEVVAEMVNGGDEAMADAWYEFLESAPGHRPCWTKWMESRKRPTSQPTTSQQAR